MFTLKVMPRPRLVWLLGLSVEGLIRVDPSKTQNTCSRLRRLSLGHHDGALKAILASTGRNCRSFPSLRISRTPREPALPTSGKAPVKDRERPGLILPRDFVRNIALAGLRMIAGDAVSGGCTTALR